MNLGVCMLLDVPNFIKRRNHIYYRQCAVRQLLPGSILYFAGCSHSAASTVTTPDHDSHNMYVENFGGQGGKHSITYYNNRPVCVCVCVRVTVCTLSWCAVSVCPLQAAGDSPFTSHFCHTKLSKNSRNKEVRNY